MKQKKIFVLLICNIFILQSLIMGCKNEQRVVRVEDTRNITNEEYTVYNTVSLDALGRQTLSVDGENRRKTKYVGMFFYLASSDGGQGCYNMTELLKTYGNSIFESDSEVSPKNVNHTWGEPIWGYYKEDDPWVLRKQVEMLTMIGIDFICFDTSNGPLYTTVTDKLFDILVEYQQKGWNVPKVAYQLASGNADVGVNQLETIYDKYYSNQKYNDIWFAPYGKPMSIVMEKTEVKLSSFNATEKQKLLRNYFYLRYSYWPTDTEDMSELSSPWMDFEYEQKIPYDWATVSVAQHTTSAFSDTIGSRGRGWNYITGKNESGFESGLNYENQWATVFKNQNKVTFTYITQWNEWWAAKYYLPSRGGYIMVDTYNDEFSRDIEPTRTGSMKDNFYLQTQRNIHKYKYSEAVHYTYPNITVDMTDFSMENFYRSNTFKDFTGECIERSYPRFDGGCSGLMLTNITNRNDIDEIKVCKDTQNIYFRIQTLDDITAYKKNDTSWLNIHIRTKNGGIQDTLGYNYIINRTIIDDCKSEVGKANGNTNYIKVGEAEYSVLKNVMIVKVPLKILGLNAKNFDIEFKVSDNINSFDVLDYYSNGDSAPIGGLSYKFGY